MIETATMIIEQIKFYITVYKIFQEQEKNIGNQLTI